MNFFAKVLRRIVRFPATLAESRLITMMGVTCVDVVLRKFGHPGKALLNP